MYPGEASSRLLLSVPSSCQLVFGVPVGWDGLARVGLNPEPFAGYWCRGSHWLTHLRLSPEIAAQQLAPLWCHRRPTQEGSLLPTPGGVGAQRALGDTPSGTHAPATPAHTCSQSRQHTVAHPSPTRHPPWHTHVTALLAPGTGGHGPGMCSTPGLSPQAGVGMDGDRGTCAALPALWHALPHAGTSQPGPPTTWVGVTRTRCPCTPPWPGRLGQGPGAGWGGGLEQWAPLILPPIASASTPILPSAWLPMPRGRDGGQGATPRKMDG